MSWEHDNDRAIKTMMMPDVAALAARHLLYALADCSSENERHVAVYEAFKRFEKHLQDENKRLMAIVQSYAAIHPRPQCAGSKEKPPALVQPNGVPETAHEAFRDEIKGSGDPVSTKLAATMTEAESLEWYAHSNRKAHAQPRLY